MSARPGARWVRVVLAVAAAVVAVLVFVALVGDEGAAERRRAQDDAALEDPRATADVVLASSDAPQAAELAATATSDEPRRAAAVGESGALRWCDVLRPVDALSGVALTDVRVAHAQVALADMDVEPTWRTLDQQLDANDFAAPGFVVVDTPVHAPALVELKLALAAQDKPVFVDLVPSANVRIDIVCEDAGTSVASIERLLLIREDLTAYEPSPIEELGGDLEVRSVGRFDVALGLLTVDGDAYFDMARSFAGEQVLMELGVSLHTRGRSNRTRDIGQVATWTPAVAYCVEEGLGTSTTIRGLPAGVSFELQIRRSTHLAFEPADPDSPFGDSLAPLVLEPGELRVITVRLLGSADVIGALPGGATDGAVELAWCSADGTWVACESRRELSGGEFRFDDLRPGTWRAAATWRDASGAHVRVAREFELFAGDTYDLGVLAPNDGVDVTIVPRVEIDGVIDETLLGGALLGTTWRIDHTGASFDGELESAACARLEPLVLRGIVGDEFVVSFDRPRLPPAAAAQVRFVEWRCASRYVLDGPLRVDAVLCLATSLRVPLVFAGPFGPSSPFTRVKALARRIDFEEVRTIEMPRAFSVGADGELFGVDASLDPGTWEIHAAIGTQSPFEEDDGELSWYGSTRVTVAAAGVPVRVELAPAATVVFGPNFDWRGAEPADFFQVVPVDAPDALAPLAYPWPGDGVTHDAAVDGLAPDTEYRVLGSDVRFRTGASGSRSVLE